MTSTGEVADLSSVLSFVDFVGFSQRQNGFLVP